MKMTGPSWLLTALTAIGAICLIGIAGVEASGPPVFEGTGGMTFSDLGWQEDMVVDSNTAARVSFMLPPEVRQGRSLWYGVRLKFHWKGSPGAVGDYAFLYARWNQKAVYQFKTKRVSDLVHGFKWSMVDMVNGSSSGFELGDELLIHSTNIAQNEAVTGGLNELVISLALEDASNKDISAIISRESEIIATSWQPTMIDGYAEAQVTENVVNINMLGENLGWGAHDLKVKALVWSGVHYDERIWDLGPLDPLGKVQVQERLVLEEGRSPHRVDVELDWGTGRQYYIAWDSTQKETDIPFISGGVFRSTIGLIVAVSVLWVALPALVSALRAKRRHEPL